MQTQYIAALISIYAPSLCEISGPIYDMSLEDILYFRSLYLHRFDSLYRIATRRSI